VLFRILQQAVGNVQRPSRLTHAVKLRTKKAGEILFTGVWGSGLVKAKMKASILEYFPKSFEQLNKDRPT